MQYHTSGGNSRRQVDNSPRHYKYRYLRRDLFIHKSRILPDSKIELWQMFDDVTQRDNKRLHISAYDIEVMYVWLITAKVGLKFRWHSILLGLIDGFIWGRFKWCFIDWAFRLCLYFFCNYRFCCSLDNWFYILLQKL